MDSGDEQELSSSLMFKKIYDDRLPKHDSAKNPEGTQKWLNACDEVVQSMTSSGGDKLINMQRNKMPEIGARSKKSIDNAPPWLQADAELNYSSLDDEPLEKTEAEKAKGKKATSESSESKSSSEELFVEEETLPADGQPVPRGHTSNIQSSALADSGIRLSPAAKKLDKALFHALKRCVIGPVALHFDRVTKCSYVQVTLLMYKDIFHSGPRAKLNTLGNMLDIPWNGNVEEWKATIMDRHMKLRTVKFNLRELSLFGVLMSSQKVSPSLYSQVGVMVATMDPGTALLMTILPKFACWLSNTARSQAAPVSQSTQPFQTQDARILQQKSQLHAQGTLNILHVVSVEKPTMTGRIALLKTHAISVEKLDILPKLAALKRAMWHVPQPISQRQVRNSASLWMTSHIKSLYHFLTPKTSAWSKLTQSTVIIAHTVMQEVTNPARCHHLLQMNFP